MRVHSLTHSPTHPQFFLYHNAFPLLLVQSLCFRRCATLRGPALPPCPMRRMGPPSSRCQSTSQSTSTRRQLTDSSIAVSSSTWGCLQTSGAKSSATFSRLISSSRQSTKHWRLRQVDSALRRQRQLLNSRQRGRLWRQVCSGFMFFSTACLRCFVRALTQAGLLLHWTSFAVPGRWQEGYACEGRRVSLCTHTHTHTRTHTHEHTHTQLPMQQRPRHLVRRRQGPRPPRSQQPK